jgi:hypothetical protein
MLKVSSDVLWYDLEGELVLLNTGTGRYHGLDSVGGFIFRALASNQGVPELVESLTKQYDVGVDVARAEVDRFIGELRAAKLLTDEASA